MPLVRSFEISKKKGKEAWVNPKIEKTNKIIHFEVREGKGKIPDGTVNRNGAPCICCGGPVPLSIHLAVWKLSGGQLLQKKVLRLFADGFLNPLKIKKQ
jgi:hypothetical protein